VNAAAGDQHVPVNAGQSAHQLEAVSMEEVGEVAAAIAGAGLHDDHPALANVRTPPEQVLEPGLRGRMGRQQRIGLFAGRASARLQAADVRIAAPVQPKQRGQGPCAGDADDAVRMDAGYVQKLGQADLRPGLAH